MQAVTVAWLGWMSMDGRAGIWRKGKKKTKYKRKEGLDRRGRRKECKRRPVHTRGVNKTKPKFSSWLDQAVDGEGEGRTRGP